MKRRRRGRLDLGGWKRHGGTKSGGQRKLGWYTRSASCSKPGKWGRYLWMKTLDMTWDNFMF